MRAVAVVVLALVAGCRAAPDTTPAAPTGPPRFPHAAAPHAALACAACHRATPGADDHAPCDGCHRAAFEAAPGPMCAVCHAGVTPTGVGRIVYPPQAGPRALAAEF